MTAPVGSQAWWKEVDTLCQRRTLSRRVTQDNIWVGGFE